MCVTITCCTEILIAWGIWSDGYPPNHIDIIFTFWTSYSLLGHQTPFLGLGVGMPWIRVGTRNCVHPSLSPLTDKWTAKHPLHLTSNPSSTPSPSLPSRTPPTSLAGSEAHQHMAKTNYSWPALWFFSTMCVILLLAQGSKFLWCRQVMDWVICGLSHYC